MSESWHLWAIGYEDTERAERVRAEITWLGWENHFLILGDAAVAVRHPDGSFTIDREPFPVAANIAVCTTVGFLAGLALAAPLTGAAIGALLSGGVSAMANAVGFGQGFVREVESLMKPGTSALFLLTHGGDMDVILHRVRGLGGTVLKTNVDLEYARQIQATLAATADH
jgi:uncharacterized membrane protein